MARIGATPVPGPTHMIGVPGLSGRVINPFETVAKMVSPFGEISRYKTLPEKNSGKIETYQGPALTSKTCIFLSVGLSGESCSLPSQRKGVFPSGNSSVFLSSWIDPNRLDPYLYRTRNRELSSSQWGKNVKDIIEGYPHGTKFLQDFFDCPTHHLRVLVEIILR